MRKIETQAVTIRNKAKVVTILSFLFHLIISYSASQAQNDASSWQMFGRGVDRNMVSSMQSVSLDFDIADGERVKFRKDLGSQTYANPVVVDGKIFVGANNDSKYRDNHEGDRGCLICFDAETGDFLWQLTREKLPQGRINDWPYQGICSTPHVVSDRLYVVTNRCEIMCLDVNGFRDGKNDGLVQDEVDQTEFDADIIWSVDMIAEYGVFPHNLATSSPLVYEDKVYLLTSNGVGEDLIEVPAADAPSFLCLNRDDGSLVWSAKPENRILHGQWNSPAFGIVDGVPQIYFPGGDGWLYAYHAETGDLIWKCDLNPKETVWQVAGRGTRNYTVATPVFFENSVVIGVGQEPEAGEGVAYLWRIDATKSGDISEEIGEYGKPGSANPNSGIIWRYGGIDVDGAITGRKNEPIFRRTISTVAIDGELVFAADMVGFLHCIDLQTGTRCWADDMLTTIWGSPLLVDGKVFIGNEDGLLVVYEASREGPTMLKQFETGGASIYSTPTFVNGMMYLTDRNSLYAVEVSSDE
mgnify:CR=1 FL=1